MSEPRRLLMRLLSFLRAGRAERELAREMTAHLRQLEDDFIRKGMSPEEARLAARRAFGGGIEQAKEVAARRAIDPLARRASSERQIRRPHAAPRARLHLRRRPHARARHRRQHRHVQHHECDDAADAAVSGAGAPGDAVAGHRRTIRAPAPSTSSRCRTIATGSSAASRSRASALIDSSGRQLQPDRRGPGRPSASPGLRVTASFFDVLGVQPMMGRTFLQEEETPAAIASSSSATACGRAATAPIARSSARRSRWTGRRTSSSA